MHYHLEITPSVMLAIRTRHVLFGFQLPDASMVSQYQEPMVLATIITPDEYVSEIISLIMVICSSMH